MAEGFFEEEQWFPKFVGALLGGMSAVAAGAMVVTRGRAPAWAKQLLMGTGGLLGLTGALAPMRTTVSAEGVVVTFGLPGWVRFRIPAEEIRRVEPVVYRPIYDFGGWGVRFALDGTRAYTARGDRGVRIETERRAFVVGSQRPESLARAVERARDSVVSDQ